MPLSGKAKLAGVLGWPVGHSLSPRLHGYWLEHYGIDGAYVPLAVAPEDLALVVRALPRMGFRGVNLTLPHKEAALVLVSEASENARRIGAVNTLTFTRDGRILGDNTDSFGFLENLKANAPAWRASAGPAVVLGAGGAAKAVVDALVQAGVPEIRLSNRSRERAETLARRMGASVVPMDWEDRHGALDQATLLVNTTTLGMQGQRPLDLRLAALPATAVVCDIVYAPLETELLRGARRRGNVVVDGLGMLLHQARPGFAAWFGTMPEVTEGLRVAVLKE